jgi:MinD-like ATPase involved in chromosome partitioning or flagellar assembly
MDIGKKVDFKQQLAKLSPKENAFAELERQKILENVIGFIPAGDSTDISLIVSNLGIHLASKGFSTCILDAKVFYPSIYKLLDGEANLRGRGLLKAVRSDKVDLRDEIIKTRFPGLYVMSTSPLDAMEDFFDTNEGEIERVIAALKDMFDMVLIDIPNLPPLEFCYSSIKNCNLGFVLWSERIECPQNTSRLFQFMSSIGIGIAKFANVIINNQMGFNYDKEIVNDMNLRLITELPFIPSVVDCSLEGKSYLTETTIIDRRFKKVMERLSDIILD